MRTLEVALGDRSYPIYIGAGLLRRGEWLTRHLDTGQVMIVTNATIAPLYLEALKAQLVGYQVGTVVLPDGEEYKTMDSAMLIWDALLDHRFSRQAHVVALGGGVIGDLAGFAAACYQRGVPFVQIPTTLLAQVDSSVGGKTAVNHRRGKNMIGAFHQPRCVIADTDTLATLADREFRAGLAEVVKYGLIRDAEFLPGSNSGWRPCCGAIRKASRLPLSAAVGTRPRWWRQTSGSPASGRCSIWDIPSATPSRRAWAMALFCTVRRSPSASVRRPTCRDDWVGWISTR